MKLIYPACFYPGEEGGYTVIVPDLQGCVTEGDTLSEAMDMTAEAMSGWLLSVIEANEPIPKATDLKNLTADAYQNGFVSLVVCDDDLLNGAGMTIRKDRLAKV